MITFNYLYICFTGNVGEVQPAGEPQVDGWTTVDLYHCCGICHVCPRVGLLQTIPRISTHTYHLCSIVSFQVQLGRFYLNFCIYGHTSQGLVKMSWSSKCYILKVLDP